MKRKPTCKSTLSVRAGQRRDSKGIVNAIEPSSAFQYIDRGDQLYPRYFNTPNQQYVIEKLVALENAEAGVIFGSGMAAISTTLLALLKPGDHAVLLDGLYGGTQSFVCEEFDAGGIAYTFAPGEVDSLVAAMRPETRLVFVETPTNPLLKIVDLQQLAAAARQRGVISLVDSTFASPINQNPIDLGIDLVIHSGTKYLGGHSDLSFGAVVGEVETVETIRRKAVNFGANLNALTCYLIERSIKTLAVRVERQNENAREVAGFLEQHPLVGRVYYPGLASSEGHELAKQQMHGFGGMLSFDLLGEQPPRDFLLELRMITAAMSLGGVESTVTMPVHTSHKPLTPEQRQKIGISDRLVRISVGIESALDIIADLEQALQTFARRSSVQPVG